MQNIKIISGTLRTRYTGPRGFAGSKIHAKGYTLKGYRRVSVDYDDALNSIPNHAAAARAWLAKHAPGAALDSEPRDGKRGGYVWTYDAAEVTP